MENCLLETRLKDLNLPFFSGLTKQPKMTGSINTDVFMTDEYLDFHQEDPHQSQATYSS